MYDIKYKCSTHIRTKYMYYNKDLFTQKDVHACTYMYNFNIELILDIVAVGQIRLCCHVLLSFSDNHYKHEK